MEATTQIFLRVQVSDDGDDDKSLIKGEALVEGYDTRILIDGFSFGMKAKLQAPGSGDRAPGKNPDNCAFDQVTVDKSYDRASWRLAGLLKPANGETQPPLLTEVRITLDQQLIEEGQGFNGGSKAQNAIMVVHLFKARLVDYKLNVSEEKASATVKEALSFTFQNVAVEYYYKGSKVGVENSDFKGNLSSKQTSDYRDTWLTFDTEYTIQDEG